MKFKFLNSALVGLILSATCLVNVASAGVIPYGVQTDIANTTVNQWGWMQCYSESESGGTNSTVSVINSSCNNSHTMMGLFNTSTDQYEVLAAGLTANVFMNTPGIFNTTISDGFNKSNGVNWYLYDNPSSVYGAWGFFSEGTVARPAHCDYQDQGNVNKNSMCMHMRDINGSGDANPADDYINDVYAYFNKGSFTTVNGSQYQVRFLSLDQSQIQSQSVPEPTTLAIFALGMIGLASRRFKKQS